MIGPGMVEYLGWAATAVFVSSYFTSRPETMRAVQVAGALIWMVYGAAIGATPVIVANALVCTAAAWTMLKARAEPTGG